jgi:hypothetical protein
MQLAGTHAEGRRVDHVDGFALLVFANHGQPGRRIWRLQCKRSMLPVSVVVFEVDPKDLLEVAAPDDQEPVRHSVRTVRIQRSA